MAQTRPHYVTSEVKTMSEGTLKIYPKELNITWGNDKRYWRLPTQQTGSAELLQVCWLQVNGIVNVKPGRYKITFSVSLKPDTFGWNACAPLVMAKVGLTGKFSHKPAKLPISHSSGEITLPNNGGLIVEVADKEGVNMQQLHFGLYEVWSEKWKGGLEIHHACIEAMQ